MEPTKHQLIPSMHLDPPMQPLWKYTILLAVLGGMITSATQGVGHLHFEKFNRFFLSFFTSLQMIFSQARILFVVNFTPYTAFLLKNVLLPSIELFPFYLQIHFFAIISITYNFL